MKAKNRNPRLHNIFRCFAGIFCVLTIVVAMSFLLPYLYFYCTNPSWDELDVLIDDESIVVLDSKHDKNDGYQAEYKIFIPKEKDRLRFLSNIKQIGMASLIETKHRANDEMEFRFPIQDYWVEIIGKDGSYFVRKTHSFR